MSTKRKLKKMVSVLFILGCFFIGNTKCKGADLEYISQETANYAVQERGQNSSGIIRPDTRLFSFQN